MLNVSLSDVREAVDGAEYAALLPWIERGRERFDREQARVLMQAMGAIREAKGES